MKNIRFSSILGEGVILPTGRKILFTTTYINGQKYDYIMSNNRSVFFRFAAPRISSYGLRFLKQNIPSIEILEYPTWNEYAEKLKKGYDVVGFSFYLNETHEIEEMVNYAREQGVKEIWGGNYGILTESIQKYFDRIFIGYAEEEVARTLGKSIDKIIHPPLLNYIETTFGIRLISYGTLFTTRGCNVGCTFCQTPAFCGKPSKVPIESIERVLKYYHDIGVVEVLILDENFGVLKRHAEEVVELLDKYKLRWGAMLRADFLRKNIEEWTKKGFYLALLGIENLNQQNLDRISKREDAADILGILSELRRQGGFAIGYYIIGFEDETVKSVKADINKLAKLKVDINQICVLTPLPQTPLYDYIDANFGIFESDWHRFGVKHLVWNHPNIAPDDMDKLLNWCFRKLNPWRRMFRVAYKYNRVIKDDANIYGGIRDVSKLIYKANTFDHSPLYLFEDDR